MDRSRGCLFLKAAEAYHSYISCALNRGEHLGDSSYTHNPREMLTNPSCSKPKQNYLGVLANISKTST